LERSARSRGRRRPRAFWCPRIWWCGGGGRPGPPGSLAGRISKGLL